jgi:glycosyltransferase involved in cell wall biosynthesis
MAIKISVVIATHFRPVLLDRCLDSLLKQDFDPREYEIIIVHDGPNEQFERSLIGRLKESPIAIRLYRLNMKSGPAAARNVGWRKASASLIAFTDDDCIPASDWLSTLYSNAVTEERVFAAYAGRTLVPLDGIPTDYQMNVSRLECASFITANCAITRQALQRVRGFDENFELAWREDSDMQFRLEDNGIAITRVPAVVIHPVRSAKWAACLREERKGMYDALLFKKHPTAYRSEFRNSSLTRYYLTMAFVVLTMVGLISGHAIITYVGIGGWIACWFSFVFKRLNRTSRSPSHVGEMVITSAVIPFLSIYWRWYGIIRFRSRPF